MDTQDEAYPFSDLALARRLERAEAHSNARFVEARAATYPEIGATWIDVAGAYAMYDGVASPVTQTFGLGLFEPVTGAVLDDIERFFRVRSAPVFHEVSPLANLELLPFLHERGYHPVEVTSVLYRPVRRALDPSLRRNEQIRVRPMEDEEGGVWAETMVRGWNEYPELAAYLLEMGPVSARRKDTVCFFAERDTVPIATGVLCLGEGVALLGGACTVPEARRQGAQLALLEHRLHYAAAHGCDLAMMCALPGSASQRNAERHGFRIAYTRIKWHLA